MAKLTVKNPGVPPGNYRARFAGVEPSTHIEYGAGLRWQFVVLTGPYAGEKVSRTTSPAPTLKNSAGKMVAAVTGRPLSIGQELDPGEYVGREYLITVEEVTGGGTRVGGAIPADAA